MAAICIFLQSGTISMTIREMDHLPHNFFEVVCRLEPMQTVSPAEGEPSTEVEVETEESSSGRYNEIAEFIEQNEALFPEAEDKVVFRSIQTISSLQNQPIDPCLDICITAISLCDEISEQGTNYVYSWIQSQSIELVPDHWELMEPKILQLIRRFILAAKQLKSPMNLKCEQFNAVMVILNKVLKPYLDCIYDLIMHPYDLLNDVNENGIPTNRKYPVAVIINRFVKLLYDYLHSPEYLQRVNDRRKMARRREKNVLRYINKLRKKYSRLLGVRVDLYLPADKKHWNHRQIMEQYHILMQKLRRSKTLHLNGYVTKLEYGFENQGLHLHCFFFFCGSKHREDIRLGRMIGEMWDKQIGGNHSYFNCNTSKNRKKYKYDALGVINRDDQTKYDNIAKVIHYFAKFEQYVLHSSLERVKTLNTGILPHLRRQMGRPNLTKHY